MNGFDFATALLAVLFGGVGLLAVVAAVADADWFFQSENARLLTGRMSRRSARVVYLVSGVLIASAGIYLLLV